MKPYEKCHPRPAISQAHGPRHHNSSNIDRTTRLRNVERKDSLQVHSVVHELPGTLKRLIVQHNLANPLAKSTPAGVRGPKASWLHYVHSRKVTVLF